MHIILGAIASGGGGTTAGTLTTWASTWAFVTPAPLREGAGWTGTLDLWGGSLVGEHYHYRNQHAFICFSAIIYSTATQHPAFVGQSSEVAPLALSVWPMKTPFDPSSAAAGGCTLLAILFAIRAYTNHWRAGSKPNPRRNLRNEKEKKGKVA